MKLQNQVASLQLVGIAGGGAGGHGGGGESRLRNQGRAGWLPCMSLTS